MGEMARGGIRTVRELARSGRTDEALALTSELLRAHGDCPYLLVVRARLVQLSSSDPSVTLEDAEACLLAALEIDAGYAPALEELAHYYDVVCPNPAKAREFAARVLEAANTVRADMQSILDDAGSA